MTPKFRPGTVVFHSKAIFGPGTVVDVRYDDEIEALLYLVQWQRDGQRLEHTEASLSRTPVPPAGRL